MHTRLHSNDIPDQEKSGQTVYLARSAMSVFSLKMRQNFAWLCILVCMVLHCILQLFCENESYQKSSMLNSAIRITFGVVQQWYLRILLDSLTQKLLIWILFIVKITVAQSIYKQSANTNSERLLSQSNHTQGALDDEFRCLSHIPNKSYNVGIS